MNEAEHLDALVIGTGQAGKPLAAALAEAGMRTAIVERGRVGGTCLITGCTPTKTMLASARVAHMARRAGDFGVDTERILGAAVLGVNGGEVVTIFQLAMMGDLPWTALAEGVFIHPTLAESLNTLFAGFSI